MSPGVKSRVAFYWFHHLKKGHNRQTKTTQTPSFKRKNSEVVLDSCKRNTRADHFIITGVAGAKCCM